MATRSKLSGACRIIILCRFVLIVSLFVFVLVLFVCLFILGVGGGGWMGWLVDFFEVSIISLD